MKKLLSVLLLFLVACSARLTDISTPAVKASPTPQSLPTITVVPPTPTLTALPTSIQSLTPLPTLQEEIGLENLYSWLEGTNNCLLPCWGGIIPGQTTWDEAIQITQSMRSFSSIDVYLGAECDFGECNLISWSLPDTNDGLGYIYSLLPDNKIHIMRIEVTDSSSLVNALNLKDILNHYGKPSILLMSALPVGFGQELPGELALELILVYPDRQFVVKYLRPARLSGDFFTSCESANYIKLIILDNKEQLMSVNVIADATETKDLGVDVWHKPVEEATEMTIDRFYETYKNSDAPCITTPISVWQP